MEAPGNNSRTQRRPSKKRSRSIWSSRRDSLRVNPGCLRYNPHGPMTTTTTSAPSFGANPPSTSSGTSRARTRSCRRSPRAGPIACSLPRRPLLARRRAHDLRMGRSHPTHSQHLHFVLRRTLRARQLPPLRRCRPCPCSRSMVRPGRPCLATRPRHRAWPLRRPTVSQLPSPLGVALEWAHFRACPRRRRWVRLQVPLRARTRPCRTCR
jgi:hypothetical protein